jgi:hypothetical protein
MGSLSDRPTNVAEGTSPEHVDQARDLGQARGALLRQAVDADRPALLTMLAEALTQIERVGPRISGDVWEAYLAVERAADRPAPPDG